VSAVGDSLRTEVVRRARGCCEYCRLPSRGQVATFPIDHVTPRTAGGNSELSNLALACPHCNAHKSAAVDGPDPTTGERCRLFDPRLDSWEDHFEWSSTKPGELVARTGIARATIGRLKMNDPDMVCLRRLLSELGLFPEVPH
jgi:hypothetical protein